MKRKNISLHCVNVNVCVTLPEAFFFLTVLPAYDWVRRLGNHSSSSLFIFFVCFLCVSGINQLAVFGAYQLFCNVCERVVWWMGVKKKVLKSCPLDVIQFYI